MKSLTESQKILAAFVAGLLVGAAALGLWNSTQAPGPVADENTDDQQAAVSENDTESADTNMDTDSTTTAPDSNSAPETGADTAADMDSELTVVTGQARVTVSDQAAGGRVVTDTVELPTAAWVAIHEVQNGQIGNVLGAQWLPTGTHTNRDVTLLRPTVAGNTYQIRLYADDDGDHAFELEEDPMIVSPSGNAVATSFTATE